MSATTRREWRAGARSSATVHVLRRVLAWFKPIRLRCLLVGHDDYLARERTRLFLRCGECERCTPGWAIGPDPRETRRTPQPQPVRISNEFITAVAHR